MVRHALPSARNLLPTHSPAKGCPRPADDLIRRGCVARQYRGLSFIPLSQESSSGGLIGPMKHAMASRLGKASIGIPVATPSLGGPASLAHDSVEHRNAEQALREQKYALDQHAIVATTDVQGTI